MFLLGKHAQNFKWEEGFNLSDDVRKGLSDELNAQQMRIYSMIAFTFGIFALFIGVCLHDKLSAFKVIGFMAFVCVLFSLISTAVILKSKRRIMEGEFRYRVGYVIFLQRGGKSGGGDGDKCINVDGQYCTAYDYSGIKKGNKVTVIEFRNLLSTKYIVVNVAVTDVPEMQNIENI